MSTSNDGALRYDKLHHGEDLSYVQKVMESLSDGVGSLLLAIIPLQDGNAPLPDQLPTATQSVSKLCDDVVSVARELGEQEYDDYPKIQKEIFDACEELSSATQALLGAVGNLGRCQPAERSDKWNDLGEGVKVIVAKTIQLLEIVYNCELLRLWEATQRLLEAARALDPSKAPTDAVGVRDKASDLATRAKEVAGYMHDVAAQQPSELVRNELDETADKLDALADQILAATNELLRDRANPEKQRRVKELTAQMEDALQRAQAALDALQLMGNKSGETGADTEKVTPIGSDWETSRDRDHYDTCSDFDPEDELAFAAKKAKDEVERLLAKAKEGDRQGTDDSARRFQKEAASVADLARELADDLKSHHDDDERAYDRDRNAPSSSSSSSQPHHHHHHGPSAEDLERAERLSRAAEQLRELAAPTSRQARELAGDRDDATKRVAAETAVASVLRVLEEVNDDVRRKNPNAAIDASVHKIHSDADAMAHGPRSLKNVEEAGRAIERELHTLKEFPGAVRAEKQHRDVSETLLPLLIEDQLKSVQDRGHKENPRIYDAVVEATEALGEKTKTNHAAELIEATRRSEEQVRRLQESALAKEPAKMKEAADELLALKEQMRGAADALVREHNGGDATRDKDEAGDSSSTGKKVAGALADYEAGLPLVLRDGVAVIRDDGTRAAGLRGELETDVGRLLDDLRRLRDVANAETLSAIKEQKEDVAELSAAVVYGDKAVAVPKARAIAGRQAEAIRRGAEAYAESVKESNPAQHRAVHERLDELDRLLPEQLAAAREVLARPDDERAKQRLRHANHATNTELDALAGALMGDRSAYGRPGPYNQHHEQLAALIPAIVRTAEDGDYERLQEALEKASRQLACLPTGDDDAEQERVRGLVAKEKRLVDEVEEHAGGSGSPPSQQEVLAAAQGLAENNARLAEAAKQAANRMGIADPRRRHLQEAAETLQQLFPTYVQTAKETLRDPSDAGAERRRHDLGQRMKEIADSIEGTVCGSSSGSPFDRLEQLVDAVKHSTDDLQEAAKAGQVPQAARHRAGLAALEERAGDVLRDVARALGGDNADAQAVRELVVPVERAMQAVGHTGEMVARQPHNGRLVFALDDEIGALIRLLEDTVARTKAAPLAAIEREERALQNVLANPSNPELRDQLQQAQEQLREALAPFQGNAEVQRHLQQLEERSVPAVVACRDPSKLALPVVQAQSELAQLRALLNPTADNAIAAACKQEEGAVAGLTELKGAQEKLVPLVEAKIATLPPALGRELGQLLEELKGGIANELVPSAGPVLANPGDRAQQDKVHNITERLRDVLEEIADASVAGASKPVGDEVRDAAEDLDDLIAVARDPRKRTDRKRLLELAAKLADRLRSMIENARRDALERGLDTAELDNILRALNETEAGILAGTHSLGDIDALLQRFAQLQQPSAASSSAPLQPLPEGPRPEPVTLDEKLHRVAEEVHDAVASTTTATQSYLPTGLLADEFRKLASAAKEGDRSNMILIGRNIHSLIAALVAKLLQLANTCKDKYLKDRLLRFVDPLRNYSTQLKILCSVKAATNKPDADADDQLASITKSLGNIVAETVKSVDTGIKTKRLTV